MVKHRFVWFKQLEYHEEVLNIFDLIKKKINGDYSAFCNRHFKYSKRQHLKSVIQNTLFK